MSNTAPRKRGRPSKHDKFGIGAQPGTVVRRHARPQRDWHRDNPGDFAATGGFSTSAFKDSDRGATTR